MMHNSPDQRYARHLALPDFGPAEQQKLSRSSVLVVGAGGLGAPLLLYLAAAGVGRIGIIDGDQVDISNLQRQILYSTSDRGKNKAEVAAQKLRALNPLIQIETFPFRLSANNALQIFPKYDYIADGSDNFPTRYLVNDASVVLGKPNVYASVFRYEGQVSVFNLPRDNDRRGPNYRDLYPCAPPPESIPNCAEAGVLGSLTGIIGSIQANELIKLITGIGQCLDARLLLLDSRNMQTQILQLPQYSKNNIRQLANAREYEQHCPGPIPEISARQLEQWLQNGHPFQLLDVRTKRERMSAHLGGLHIPLDQLPNEISRLDHHTTWVVYCHSGLRSATATKWMIEHGYSKVYNLRGGLIKARHLLKNNTP